MMNFYYVSQRTVKDHRKQVEYFCVCYTSVTMTLAFCLAMVIDKN